MKWVKKWESESTNFREITGENLEDYKKQNKVDAFSVDEIKWLYELAMKQNEIMIHYESKKTYVINYTYNDTKQLYTKSEFNKGRSEDMVFCVWNYNWNDFEEYTSLEFSEQNSEVSRPVFLDAAISSGNTLDKKICCIYWRIWLPYKLGKKIIFKLSYHVDVMKFQDYYYLVAISSVRTGGLYINRFLCDEFDGVKSSLANIKIKP